MSINMMSLLALLAFFLTILAAVGESPLWIPVFLLALIELIREIPLEKGK